MTHESVQCPAIGDDEEGKLHVIRCHWVDVYTMALDSFSEVGNSRRIMETAADAADYAVKCMYGKSRPWEDFELEIEEAEDVIDNDSEASF